MSKTEIPMEETMTTESGDGWSTAGVVFGALGVFTAVWAYWMIVPGIIFGIAAVVLGIRARGRSAPEAGSVALALGIAALLLVPSVLFMIDGAEDWGRDCALNPTKEDCWPRS